MAKHLRYFFASSDPRVLAPQLIELISAGRARPSFISTAAIRIDEVPGIMSGLIGRRSRCIFISLGGPN